MNKVMITLSALIAGVWFLGFIKNRVRNEKAKKWIVALSLVFVSVGLLLLFAFISALAP